MDEGKIQTMRTTHGAYTECLLQAGEPGGHDRIVALQLVDNHMLLTVHAQPDDGEEYGEVQEQLTLTPQGLATLVEMWALRFPAAFQRLAAKVSRLARPCSEHGD